MQIYYDARNVFFQQAALVGGTRDTREHSVHVMMAQWHTL
jgi:hypothetical protein